MKKEEKIISYKSFNEDFKCRGFQYEVGKEYQHDGKVSCCESGFHACEDPLEVFDHYPMLDSRFAIVEQSGEIDRGDGTTKVCSSRIFIKKEVDLAELIKLGIEWLIDKTKPSRDSANIVSTGYSANIVSTGDSAQIGSSWDYVYIDSTGDYVYIDSTGYSAKIVSSGDFVRIDSSRDFARIASTGGSAKIGSTGDSAQIVSSGDFVRIDSSRDFARIASTGGSAKIASSGDFARIASTGDFARIASTGGSAKISSTGKYSVIMCAGKGCTARGKVGSRITLAEWEFDIETQMDVLKCEKTEHIDGEKIKADTWYQLVDGEFRETKQ